MVSCVQHLHIPICGEIDNPNTEALRHLINGGRQGHHQIISACPWTEKVEPARGQGPVPLDVGSQLLSQRGPGGSGETPSLFTRCPPSRDRPPGIFFSLSTFLPSRRRRCRQAFTCLVSEDSPSFRHLIYTRLHAASGFTRYFRFSKQQLPTPNYSAQNPSRLCPFIEDTAISSYHGCF